MKVLLSSAYHGAGQKEISSVAYSTGVAVIAAWSFRGTAGLYAGDRATYPLQGGCPSAASHSTPFIFFIFFLFIWFLTFCRSVCVEVIYSLLGVILAKSPGSCSGDKGPRHGFGEWKGEGCRPSRKSAVSSTYINSEVLRRKTRNSRQVQSYGLFLPVPELWSPLCAVWMVGSGMEMPSPGDG